MKSLNDCGNCFKILMGDISSVDFSLVLQGFFYCFLGMITILSIEKCSSLIEAGFVES